MSVLVENKPGVLARVAGLFSRRGFNIHSLAVGPTENADISRMTIVVAVDEFPLEQVTKQLNKLINVIKIVELEPTMAVQRELLLVKVRADATVRSQVLETVTAVPGQGGRRRPGGADHRGHRHRRQARGAACGCSSPTASARSPQSGMVAMARGPRVHHRSPLSPSASRSGCRTLLSGPDERVLHPEREHARSGASDEC